MELICAKSEVDWARASNILFEVIEGLDKKGKSLWLKSQVEVIALKKHYRLEELYFLSLHDEIAGVVFVQSEDMLFWPEIKHKNSYFIHKLAVLPKFNGYGYGYKIIDFVLHLAKQNGRQYLRLDCDPRPELMAYYERYGFSFVANARVGSFPAVKYELLLGCDVTR